MRILSGIRPSGALHLGNYVGAIKQWVELQRTHEVFYMIADLHALTTPYSPSEFPQQIRETVADYLAAGLNPKRATIFLQSHVLETTQLMWILATLTPTGELGRMTQYKEKVREGAPANAGLLNYPILMAADILLYRAEGVPVGEDQVQHVELARSLARKFNRAFGNLFPVPQPLLTEGKRVMSLKDPHRKMSKTGDEGIALTDDPASIKRKLAKAVTATSGGGKSLGVENLLVLLRTFAAPAVVARFEGAERNGTIRYAELKATLAQTIADHFAPFRAKRRQLLADPASIAKILEQGARQARVVATETITRVYQKVGLRR